MSLNAESIKKIEDMVADGLIIKAEDGKEYSAKKLSRVIDYPTPNSIVVSTLTGLTDYIETNIDGLVLSSCVVIVEGHDSVILVNNLDNETQKRRTYIQASLPECSGFKYGQFMSSEEFIIKMGSLFHPTNGLSEILKYSSKLCIENKIHYEDDGVSQSAIVKKSQSGAISENAVAPSIVELKPMRTFVEIDQPVSEFLFRIKEERGEIKCALFEADGGAWKSTAMKSIKEYLQRNIQGAVKVIA